MPRMHVVIFEGTRWHTFAPISLSRPLFTLATGMSTLLDKQLRHLRPTRLSLWVRPEMEAYCRERIVPTLNIPCEINKPLDEEPALMVSARTVHFGRYEYPPHDAVIADEDRVRSARVTMPGLSWEDVWNRTPRWMTIFDLPRGADQSRMVESLWDLIHWNEESLIEDATQLESTTRDGAAPSKPAGPYHMVRDDDVWLVGKDARLSPGCVLDATSGPVVIGEGACIGANAVIEGPIYIGPYAVIKPLSHIRPGTSIGTACRVGGEVCESVILDYSNKSHDGFMGHSYVGKWVNLGAGTTTSNLKNTYGEISVQVGGQMIPTGRRFLGALIGDHAKTGILTRLPTGCYVGFASMLTGRGFAPKFLPSYTYWTENGTEPWHLEKAIQVAQRTFARRDREWTAVDEQLMRYAQQAAPGIES
jgi:UDP-N-acetylglucosamine diphosphorylase/glucosamine-1-phosphate N-acetyltransferase